MMKPVLLVLSMMVSAPLWAIFYTGNDLIDSCKNLDATCTVFMMAVADTFAMLEVNDNLVRYPLCIPEGVTGGEMANLMTAFLGEHPEFVDDSAVSIAHLALFQAFPCDT